MAPEPRGTGAIAVCGIAIHAPGEKVTFGAGNPLALARHPL
jgi:hypothetical protein